MDKSIVYLSASYKAPPGMKEHVYKLLQDYECEVVVWDDHDSNEDSIRHLEEKVTSIIMIPPAETYYDEECTIGRGQWAELDAFLRYAWDKETGEMGHSNYNALLVNLDTTLMKGSGLYVDEINPEYLDKTEGSQYDPTCNAAGFTHNGAAINIGSYLSPKYPTTTKKKSTKIVMTDFEESEMTMKESKTGRSVGIQPAPTVLIAYDLIK